MLPGRNNTQKSGASASALLGKTLAGFLLAGMLAAPAGAQRGKSKSIPPGHLPRAGECRVWYDNVPPGKQPPPTSCAAARREADRTGGRLVYGAARGDTPRDRDDRDRTDRDRTDRDRTDRERAERDRADRDRTDRDRTDRDRTDRDRTDRDRTDRDRTYPDPRVCTDADRRNGVCGTSTDGRYPDGRYPQDEYPAGEYPATLPEMVWGVILARGETSREVRQWLRTDNARPQVADSDRNGVPEVVTWVDSNGRILQRWSDDDRNGRANRVELFRDDRVVRVIR